LELLYKIRVLPQDKLSEKDLKDREKLFEQAERFVNNAQGVDSPFGRSFRSRKKRGVRVDLEIKAGRAFVLLVSLFFLFFWLIN
jgi:hypothetical protein